MGAAGVSTPGAASRIAAGATLADFGSELGSRLATVSSARSAGIAGGASGSTGAGTSGASSSGNSSSSIDCAAGSVFVVSDASRAARGRTKSVKPCKANAPNTAYEKRGTAQLVPALANGQAPRRAPAICQ